MAAIELKNINLDSDIRAEVIAANLAEKGVSIDHIAIRPMGGFARAFRKDVVKITVPGIGTGEETVQIDVSRDGIYDSLPHSLFHQPAPNKKTQTLADRIDDIKKQKEEEAQIRKFFLAIEREINTCKTLIEIEERKSIIGMSDEYQSDIFLNIWPELKNIDAKYHPLLLQVLPLAHKFRDNIEMVETLLSHMVNEKVSMSIIDTPSIEYYPHIQNVLGSCSLGEKIVIGNKIPNYDLQYIIRIGPILKENLPTFIYQGENIRAINFMTDYFLPYDCKVSIKIEVEKSQESLYLSDSYTSSHLGYSSTI